MNKYQELCRQRGYDYLQNSKAQHRLVEGVVPTFAAGFDGGVRHVIELLRTPEFQTNWMRGMTGEQMAKTLERIVGLD